MNVLLFPFSVAMAYAVTLTIHQTICDYTRGRLILINRLCFSSQIGFLFVQMSFAFALWEHDHTQISQFDHPYTIEGQASISVTIITLLFATIISIGAQKCFIEIIDMEDYEYFIGTKEQAARAPSLVVFEGLP